MTLRGRGNPSKKKNLVRASFTTFYEYESYYAEVGKFRENPSGFLNGLKKNKYLNFGHIDQCKTL